MTMTELPSAGRRSRSANSMVCCLFEHEELGPTWGSMGLAGALPQVGWGGGWGVGAPCPGPPASLLLEWGGVGDK